MADKDKGYIYLYRSIQDNFLWTKDIPFDCRSAFIDMLFMANYKDKELVLRNGKKKIIKRGQFHTSISNLAKRWRWSEGRVRRFLDTLDEHTMAHTNRTTDGTTVTIVNYEDFQVRRQTNGTTDGRTDGTTDDTTDDREVGRGVDSRLNTSNTRNTSKKRKKEKEAAPQSFYSHMPGWHIQDGWELWKDENGSWHRALIGQKED